MAAKLDAIVLYQKNLKTVQLSHRDITWPLKRLAESSQYTDINTGIKDHFMTSCKLNVI